MLVSDVMVKQVGHISKRATLIDAAEMMRTNQIGSVIVADGESGKLVPIGVLTDRDIVVEVVADDVESRKLIVEDVMTRDVVTIPVGASIFSAVQIMEREGIRRLPVIDERGALCGIVTADDLAGHLAVAIHSLSRIPGLQRIYEKHARTVHF
jgi:CBS domain-containing protein